MKLLITSHGAAPPHTHWSFWPGDTDNNLQWKGSPVIMNAPPRLIHPNAKRNGKGRQATAQVGTRRTRPDAGESCLSSNGARLDLGSRGRPRAHRRGRQTFAQRICVAGSFDRGRRENEATDGSHPGGNGGASPRPLLFGGQDSPPGRCAQGFRTVSLRARPSCIADDPRVQTRHGR